MSPIEGAFVKHRQMLWGLSYRMLGTRADADEVVQDAFERALRKPPKLDRPLRPWLVRVTVNVARDRLRRRRRAAYSGPWLPEPLVAEPTAPPGERLEEAGYALLVALEQLTPTQRAVWLLREVMGLSTLEVADILEVQGGTVKVTLHRARKALYGVPAKPEVKEGGMGAVAALANAILLGDVGAVAALLTDDVVALSDGGGVYHAARRAIVGPDRVARLLIGLAAKNPTAIYRPVEAAGCPGVVVETVGVREGFAPVGITLFGVVDGQISHVWSVLAPTKVGQFEG